MKRLWPVLPYVLYLAMVAPFADKSFHVEDPVFVSWAQHLRAHPDRPLEHEVVWNGQKAPMTRLRPSPPLHAYVLAAASSIAGDASEKTLHWALFPFGFLALWAVGRLARRFGVSPLLAQLLVAVSPVVVLASHSVMPDLTLFGLGSAAAALCIRAIDEDRRVEAVLGGLALGAAILTDYNAVVLAVVVALYPLVVRKPWRRVALPLGLAGALVAAWVAAVLAHGSNEHFAATFSPRQLPLVTAAAWNGLSSLVFLGSVLIFPPLLAWPTLRRKVARWVLLAVALATGATFAVLHQRGVVPAASVAWLLPIFLTAGLAFAAERLASLARVLTLPRRTPADADELLLSLWVLGAWVLPLGYMDVAARCLLMALVPVVLLFLRHSAGRAQKALCVAAIMGGALLSTLAGAADQELAELPQRVVRDVVRPLLGQGRTVWFTPQWGYSHYLAAAGARPLHEDEKPATGDLIVATTYTPPLDLLDRMNLRVRERARTNLRARLPVAVMTHERSAGYYSNHRGWLPFAPSERGTKLERIRVLEVLDAPTPGASAPPEPSRETPRPKP